MQRRQAQGTPGCETTVWTKVKSHMDVPKELATPADWHIVINDHADRRAKESLTWHQVSEQAQTEYKNKAGRAARFLREAGEILAQFPRPKDEDLCYSRPKGSRTLKVRTKHQHDWYWTAQGSWRCRHCLRRKWHSEGAADFVPCGMISGTILRLGMHTGCHALSGALIDDGPACILYCRRCGGIAEYMARKLASDKCLPPTSTGRRYLDRIAAGKHPTRDAYLSDTWDLSGEGTQNTAGNRAWQGNAAEDQREGEIRDSFFASTSDEPEESASQRLHRMRQRLRQKQQGDLDAWFPGEGAEVGGYASAMLLQSPTWLPRDPRAYSVCAPNALSRFIVRPFLN